MEKRGSHKNEMMSLPREEWGKYQTQMIFKSSVRGATDRVPLAIFDQGEGANEGPLAVLT